MREPAVIGDEEENLRPFLREFPHLRRVGVLKANGNAELKPAGGGRKRKRLQFARRAGPDRRQLLQGRNQLVAGDELAERNKMHFVVDAEGLWG